MAGLGRKMFTRERATSADVQGYLMDQAVMRFPSESAREVEIPTPSEGMVSYLDDANRWDGHDGSGWKPIAYAAPQAVWGTYGQATDANGVVTIVHNLGSVPLSAQLTIGVGPAQASAKGIVNAKSSTQIQCIFYNTQTGAPLASVPCPFDWVVFR